jgi:two-component system OmpR family sensor kinase
VKRLPLRVRVAAAFAVAMALVLTATGLFLYERLGQDLSAALDTDLRLRAQDLGQLVGEPGGSLAAESNGRLIERGESFAQLLNAKATVLDGTAPPGQVPLLGPAELRSPLVRATFIDRSSVPGLDEPARLLATSAVHDGQPTVLVVGATRENRAEALRSLRTELLLVGPLALVLATALGYVLAGAGLRAVEVMRRRAAAISGAQPGERLPVQATGDELSRLGTTLNEMLGRLDEARERERGFVADAGHELRTPVALLRAELDFALHHAETEEELRGALQVASDETDRLAQLAGDLLLIAASDGGALPLRREHIRAGDLLESVRNRFASRGAEAGRALQVWAPPDLMIDGDRLRLEQAIGNLVDNALRHGAGIVRIDARRADRAAELHVRDEGPGLPEDFVARAFHRFSRADEAHTGGGAGLGLAIVHTIALAHGGTAHVLGEGNPADIYITVPTTPRRMTRSGS